MPFDPTNYEGMDRISHLEKYVGKLCRQLNCAEAFGITGQGYDFLTADTGVALTSQKVYGVAVYLYAGETITNLLYQATIAAVGTAPTYTKMGIWSADPTAPKCLAVTGDFSASLLSPGPVIVPLTAPFVVPTSGFYYLALSMNGAFGTTQPNFARSQLIGSGNNQIGTGLRFSPILATGNSTFAVNDVGTYSGGSTNPWLGFS